MNEIPRTTTNCGVGLPWAFIFVVVSLESAIIAAVRAYPMYLWIPISVLMAIMLLTTISIFLKSSKECCYCCRNSNDSDTPESNRTIRKWCCTYIGIFVVLFLGLAARIPYFVVFEYLSDTWFFGLYAIGIGLIPILILLLSWMAKLCLSSDNGTKNFWTGYWVSLWILVSCGWFAFGFLVWVGKILSDGTVEVDPIVGYIMGGFGGAYVVCEIMIMIVFVMRIAKWHLTKENTNANNTSTTSNGIPAVDLFSTLVGFPLGPLFIVWIPLLDLYVSLLLCAVSTILVIATWHKFKFWGNNTPIASANENRPSTTRTKKYPKDSYSFLALYSPKTDINLFCFGLMVFLFQSTMLILMILSVIVPQWRIMGEVDNPDAESKWWAGFMPANTDPLVRATQITSIWSYLIFQEADSSNFTNALELFPEIGKFGVDRKRTGLVFSSTLKFIQAILSMFAVFLLVMTETDVTDIILNYTAVNFISFLDNVAFAMARSGKYGPVMKEAALRIEFEDLPPEHIILSSKNKRFNYALVGIFLFLFIPMVYIVTMQEKNSTWVTQTARVTFEDSSLSSYSGCYKIDRGNRINERFVYKGFEKNERIAKLGYCKSKRRWLFFKGNDPCKAFNSNQELARSPKTNCFDIETLFEENWFSSSNSPLDMYFIRDDNLEEHCGFFVGDGICDSAFNNVTYQYDEGDCCAATCTQPSCGKNEITAGFGINSTGDGYPKCDDPVMVSITIRMDEMIFKTDQLQNSLLNLNCTTDSGNTYDVFSITATRDMVNKTEGVMVEDRSTCSFYVKTLYNGSTNVDPIVKYSVFHGYNNDDIIAKNQFIIFQGESQTNTIAETFQVGERSEIQLMVFFIN